MLEEMQFEESDAESTDSSDVPQTSNVIRDRQEK